MVNQQRHRQEPKKNCAFQTVQPTTSTTVTCNSRKTTADRESSATLPHHEQVLRVKNQINQTSFTNNLQTSSLSSEKPSDRLQSKEVDRRCLIPIPNCIASEPTSAVSSRTTGTATANKRKTHLIRNTPTDLYQFYQKDWERFRNLLPGENSRSSVRAEVRQRMEHKPPPKPKVYLRFGEDQKKTMTTQVGRRQV